MGELLRPPRIGQAIKFVIICLGSLLFLMPLLWLVSSSFKLDHEIFEYPIQWIPEVIHWRNYVELFIAKPFHLYFLNTLKLAILITAGQLLSSSLAAYAFSRIQFRGREKLFLVYLSTMMIPPQVLMIPQFFIIRNMGLMDSHTALILLEIWNVFGVFLLRQFFLTIPFEVSEAARIDGCKEFTIFYRIILPLAKPALATLTIFSFVWVWNDLLNPLIYINSDYLKTLTIALAELQDQSAFESRYHLLMAGTVISLVPLLVIFVFFQRFFTDGITAGAVKG